MPKFSEEMEEKITALFEQRKKNSVISRKLGINRGALPKRRKEWEKRNQDHQKPEPESEEIIQQEPPDSHPLDAQLYILIRYQGTKSREEALSQAIETQHSFNPYILNHGLKTPKELIKFLEDKIKIEPTNVEYLELDSERIIELEKRMEELIESTEHRLKNEDACKHIGKYGYCSMWHYPYDEVEKKEYLRPEGKIMINGKTVYFINVRNHPLICSACPSYETKS